MTDPPAYTLRELRDQAQQHWFWRREKYVLRRDYLERVKQLEEQLDILTALVVGRRRVREGEL